ncbi:MAG: alanine/ornithine racemase family PLP-dependent enzyme [Clostridiales Family XIII bacterium]|jgi:predicted amino acid racemase|nr:alanine/ornithine racemase family PLP-dependent enzyme [Clostridiales Family XIII bacterium]
MYPILEIDLGKLEHNAREIVKRCKARGIEVAGVIKGCSGIPECAAAIARGGCAYLASSRLGQLEAARRHGVELPFMMIRIPMLSEAAEVVRVTEVSLNSEAATLRRLHEEAGKQGRVHKVILMAELGDLREGVWDRRELLELALRTENEWKNLTLQGIGTNLGCYGSIAPTVEKMEELVRLAEEVERAIGRKLAVVSGGASTSFPRVMDENMPARVNSLRIGENILFGRDLKDLWGYDTHFLHSDVFVLKAEIIEVKTKPSHPVGEITFDAFRNRPAYTDRGLRRRALAAIGRVDYAWTEQILPRDAGVTVLGASSDHTILDIEEARRDFIVGDVVEFELCYGPAVFLSHDPDVRVVFTGGGNTPAPLSGEER